MKRKSGILVILLSIVITAILWVGAKPTRTIPAVTEYSELLAAFALVAFAFINFISTRHRFLDDLFDGLDKSYIYHKYLSISALVLVVIHNITISIGKKVQISSGIKIPRDPYAMYGSFSLYLFVILILVAILAKKLNYERWKNVHKFMILAYAMGLYHYYGSSDYAALSFGAFSLWMDFINLIGILSVLYSVFIYESLGFKYKFKATKLDIVANGTLEITGGSIGKSMDFKPGQFAFLKIKGDKNNFASHPFTISEAPKKGEIQFTIKGLGDDTKKLFETLKVGDEFSVEGPHGKFHYSKGLENQIWIAGGIGVTPFRSFLQGDIPKNYSVDFFYAYNNAEEGAYVDELKALAENKENIKLHLINSKEKGFLTADKILQQVEIKQNFDVYFYGPKPMREALTKQFESSSAKVNELHYENFQFK